MQPFTFDKSSSRTQYWRHVQQQVASTRTVWALATFRGQINHRIPKELWTVYANALGAPIPTESLRLRDNAWFHVSNQRIHLGIPMGSYPLWHTIVASVKDAGWSVEQTANDVLLVDGQAWSFVHPLALFHLITHPKPSQERLPVLDAYTQRTFGVSRDTLQSWHDLGAWSTLDDLDRLAASGQIPDFPALSLPVL